MRVLLAAAFVSGLSVSALATDISAPAKVTIDPVTTSNTSQSAAATVTTDPAPQSKPAYSDGHADMGGVYKGCGRGKTTALIN